MFFYDSILHLFQPCFSSLISIDQSRLFYCNQSQTWISIYRVIDKIHDCYFNEDENPSIDLCSFNTNDLVTCLSNRSQCIRESSLADRVYDCADGSDEYLRSLYSNCDDRNCGFRPWTKRILSEIYRFEELCDNVVNRHIFSLDSIETDETDCEYWPYSCDSYYTKCNQIWNCPNGRDEINCTVQTNYEIRQAFGCQRNEHYCIQLINNKLNLTCIDLNRAGNGIIDCIGGTDEQWSILDLHTRFQCMNSSLRILLDQVCDEIAHCPFGDDELACLGCEDPALYYPIRCTSSSYNLFYCKQRQHLWFCDLEIDKEMLSDSSYVPYKPLLRIAQNQNSKSSLCHFGFSIQSSIFPDQSYCFCPPSYYGDTCEYQSTRVTVSLQLQIRYPMNPTTTFHLMIYLLNDQQHILSYDQIIFNHANSFFRETFLIYLLSERMINVTLHQYSKSKFVRIDSYIINKNNVQYISSWFFRVSFPFLPVSRLAVNLRLMNESFKVLYCRKQCGSHGKCLHYVNAKDHEYCLCNQGYFGEYCDLKSISCHSTACSPHSQCLIINEEKKQIHCLCPLGKSGDQCYITHNVCLNNICQHNGTCLILDQRFSHIICVCSEDYDGFDCSEQIDWLYLSIDNNITNISIIPAIVTIFGGISQNGFFTDDNVLHKNITLPTIFKIHKVDYDFGFIRIYYNQSTNFYYVVLIHKDMRLVLPNTITVKSQNRCPNISELFNETILNDYTYLKRLKLYHLPCNKNHNLRCFYDEYRMCICTKEHNSDCFLYNHNYGHCNYCQNGGLCIRQDPYKHSWNSICLCSKCTYGSLCQFSPKNYYITLDMLIGIDIKTEVTSFSEQPIVIHWTFAFLIIILIISLILNTIIILIFSNKKFRQVGCDIYLLNLTIISEIGLILLFLRFIYMIIIQMYIIDNLLFIQITCIILEYTVHLIPSLFDWLTVCIAIERAYTVIKDVYFTKIIALKTLKLSRWIVLIVIGLNIFTTIHRPFYLQLSDELTINDEPRGHPWCVLDLGTSSWNIYEKFINICHLILPFIFNLVSMISFVFYRTKFELTKTKNRDSLFVVMRKQLFKYKSLLISPTIILLLEVSRFILTFILACFEHDWQRHLYLIGYLSSFIPLTGILFIYILPSPKYRNELKRVVKKTFNFKI